MYMLLCSSCVVLPPDKHDSLLSVRGKKTHDFQSFASNLLFWKSMHTVQALHTDSCALFESGLSLLPGKKPAEHSTLTHSFVYRMLPSVSEWLTILASIVLQIHTAFVRAWDAAAGQIANPRASAKDLELAQLEAEEAWKQLQESTGIAAEVKQQTLEGTKYAVSKGD